MSGPEQTKEHGAAYPRLPSRVGASGGEIVVIFQKKVISEGADCWANWDEATRTVTVDTRAPLAHQWRVFYHELAHAAMADSGADELFTETMIELLCETFANARMRERFG